MSEANSQLPKGKPGIIHIGLESHDGFIVEDERFKKNVSNTMWFDPKGKNLNWFYCHIFDPTVPPDDNWDFGETVLHFSKNNPLKEPLVHRAVALPRTAEMYDGVFWRENN